jgi:hypothetical protein
MTAQIHISGARSRTPAAILPRLARVHFASSYPEGPHKVPHKLASHSLLSKNALTELTARLPAYSVERFHDRTGEEYWTTLSNLEQEPEYAALLSSLLSEIEDKIVARTGKLIGAQISAFLSAPHAVKPYRLSSEHCLVLQVHGERTMTVFPAAGLASSPEEPDGDTSSGYLTCHGASFRLSPGEAIYVPVMAPVHVKNGDEPSIAIMISWRSAWSVAEGEAGAFNDWLRRFGLNPQPPKRWPARNRAKAIAWRILRRLPGIR